MIKTLHYYLFSLLSVVILVGCTDHRNLHVTNKPMFIVKNDWSVARLNPEGATVMFFARAEPCELMFSDPNRHKLFLDPNVYDILVFNEVMFSPTATNIDGVIYRGTDDFKTFGAYAKPNPVNPIFRADPGEVMVGYGYPDPVATRAREKKEVLTDKQYLTKYENGKKGGLDLYSDYDADSVEFQPLRVTREVKVIAHVTNLTDGFRVSATLRGMAEGVILSSRQPEGSNAAYTFNLNSAVVDPDVKDGHIIVSEDFGTFGPWWNDYPSSRKYTLDVVATKGGEVFPYSFDVTDLNEITTRCMSEAIVKIKAEEAMFLKDGTPPTMEKIIIEVWFNLPTVVDGDIDVGVGDWGEDIIIPVPIG